MKKKMLVAFLAAGCLICTSGCSSNVINQLKGEAESLTEESAAEEVTGEVTATPEVTEEAVETTEEATEVPEETEAPVETLAPVTEAPEATANADGSLSAEQVASFTEWAQEKENYGLLMSSYSDPTGVDLGQVFYIGAGMETRGLSDEERDAFAMSNGGEITTDCTVLSSADIDGYLQRKLGITLDDVIASFEWTYLPATDVWVMEHGDTNYTRYECTGGKKTDDSTYVVEFAPVDGSEYFSNCEMTLQVVDGAYQVVSNVFV